MSSLIVNKMKINMCLVSVKLSSLYALFICATASKLYNNYNNNCLFNIFLCLQTFYSLDLYSGDL